MRGIVLAAVLMLSGCTAYDKKTDLSYDQGNVPFGVFDLYTPSGLIGAKAPFPVIFFIHGGAWQGGDKSGARDFADEFCKSGYAVVSVNYRTSIAATNTGVWPAQIRDCQTALRYVRSNAGLFQLDPDRVVSMGVSAGGHLATMIHLRDDPQGPLGRTSFAVDLDGEHDMTMPADKVMTDYDGILTFVFGHAAPWTPAELRDISTVSFARTDADVFICHGTGDPNVFFPQAERLNEALLAAGGKVAFHKVEGKAGVCHGDCWQDPSVLPALHSWLDERLKR